MNTEEFLRALWPVPPRGFFTVWREKGVFSKHFPMGNWAAVAEHTRSEDTIGNVYYGVGVRRADLGSLSPGSTTHVGALPGLFIDVDYGDTHNAQNLPPDVNGALLVLDLAEVEPTLIVHTGYGLHAYYNLHEPLVWEVSRHQDAQDALVRFQKEVIRRARDKYGFHVDNTATLPRLLRLPGTRNHKRQPPVEVSVLAYSGKVYSSIQEIIPYRAPGRPSFGEVKNYGRWPTPSADWIAKLQDRCKNLKNAENLEMCRKVFMGRSFAERGSRNESMNRISAVITFAAVQDTPGVSAGELAELFRPSLTVWASEPNATKTVDAEIEIVTRMIEKHLADAHGKKEEKQAQDTDIMQALKRNLARAQPPPKTPTPPPEKPAVPEVLKNLIIVKGTSYYVFSPQKEEYVGPCTRIDSLRLEIKKHLKSIPSFDMYRLSKKGEPCPKSIDELLEDYGSHAKEIVYDVTVSHSYYDEKQEKLHLAPARKRQLTPLYDERVHKWLRLLGGIYAEKLLDWIASVDKLDRQCCALYLGGEPGTGKTLLANALARIWSEDGPTKMASIAGSFNASMLKNPFVLADESLSDEMTTTKLRELLGTTKHPVRQKYLPEAYLNGALRIFLAGNNRNMLVNDEQLSSLDMRAIASRFLFIAPGLQAKEYLESMDTFAEQWLENDIVTRHLVWLCQNRVVKPGKRFLVEGEETAMHRAIVSQMRVPAAILELLVKMICNATSATLKATPGLIVGGHDLLVTPITISILWERFIQSRRVPGTDQIIESLDVMSVEKLVFDNVEYTRLRLDYLYEAADRMQVGAAFRKRIAMPRVLPNTIAGSQKKA